jgi:hypothetical protein
MEGMIMAKGRMRRRKRRMRRTRRRYPKIHKIYMYETYEDREIIINSKNNMNTNEKHDKIHII